MILFCSLVRLSRALATTGGNWNIFLRYKVILWDRMLTSLDISVTEQYVDDFDITDCSGTERVRSSQKSLGIICWGI